MSLSPIKSVRHEQLRAQAYYKHKLLGTPLPTESELQQLVIESFKGEV